MFRYPLPAMRPLPDHDGARYGMVEPLRWVERDGTEGLVDASPDRPYVTDLASSPRPVRSLAPASGLHTPAAIRHDRRCDDLNAWHAAGRPVALLPHHDSRQADAEFRDGIRELDPRRPVRAWAMWAGVRLGAIGNPARRDGVLGDLPLLLLIVVLIAPLYLPLGLVTVVATLVDDLVQRLVCLLLRLRRRDSPPRE